MSKARARERALEELEVSVRSLSDQSLYLLGALTTVNALGADWAAPLVESIETEMLTGVADYVPPRRVRPRLPRVAEPSGSFAELLATAPKSPETGHALEVIAKALGVKLPETFGVDVPDPEPEPTRASVRLRQKVRRRRRRAEANETAGRGKVGSNRTHQSGVRSEPPAALAEPLPAPEPNWQTLHDGTGVLGPRTADDKWR